MTIERKEVGPRMSQIVVHGDTVYLAGIVAHANKGKSVTEQTTGNPRNHRQISGAGRQ